MSRTVAVGEKVLVRLALLPGMSEEDGDKSRQEVMELRYALNDPGMMQQALDKAREDQENPDLTADQLTEQIHLFPRVDLLGQLIEQIHLFPRVRPATIAYVDRTEGNISWVNLDVYTPGSTVLQGAIGQIPKYAQRHFRLDKVQMMTKEPEDGQYQHVAFWRPETEEEAPLRKEAPKRK